jgi:hypothetical protein
VLAYVGDEEVDPLMVCSNIHGDMGGLSRDGAGINRSSICYIKVDWIEEFGSRDVEFVDQGLMDEALGSPRVNHCWEANGLERSIQRYGDRQSVLRFGSKRRDLMAYCTGRVWRRAMS